MPLLDHFHPPGKKRLNWWVMSPAWALSLMSWLNHRLPRDEYRAEINVRFGQRIEADVAELRDETALRVGSQNGSVATVTEPTPPALLTLAATFPDDIEIEIREEDDRTQLVGVIELISPSNKKERAERSAFLANCVAYLKRGVGIVIVDVVTDRHASLHNELLLALGAGDAQLMNDCPTYVSGYRPVHRQASPGSEIDIWPYAAEIGQPIPAVPLGLRGGPVMMLDLQGTYTAAIESTGL